MSRNRKTNRAKRVDRACRNHGPCAWCRGNRTYSTRKRSQKDARGGSAQGEA